MKQNVPRFCFNDLLARREVSNCRAVLQSSQECRRKLNMRASARIIKSTMLRFPRS